MAKTNMKLKNTKAKTVPKVITRKNIKKVHGKKVNKSKEKKSTSNYGHMSVDDFFNKDFDDSDNESKKEKDIESEENEVCEESPLTESDADDAASDLEENDDSDGDEAENHKRDLEKLQQTDPEFYKFLQDNDKKLLNFNLSDDEADDDQEQDSEEDDDVHKPDGNLVVASDESDYEEDGVTGKSKDSRTVTLKMLKTWQSDIQTDKSNKTIIALTQGFHAALLRVSNNDEANEDVAARYKVEGTSVFNGIIQLCVLELGPAIRRFLGIHGSKQPPHKCKKFVKVKKVLKLYFMDLLKLLSVTSTVVLLKHLHYMSSFLISFPNITKSILKRLITLWGTADETARITAFFCILRITNNQQASTLDIVLKSMYMTYVKNSKFVSLNSLAAINFMRRSLVEIFALDINVAYHHVFLYIRQLAIHLRNAITVKKTENLQAVYNWQFINSLRLWGNLLSVTYSKPHMQQLVYPFVQVCLGTIKLVPTAQYYPLRFHVVQILMDLSKTTGVFIPVLPFLLEVLTSYDFNKKHQKVSMRPLDFTSLLRLSKSQLQENGFKDSVIETIYGQLLEYLACQSHTVAFPDLSFICLMHIKQFLKKCKNVNYTRKLKQIVEKIEQNVDFIEKERGKLTLNMTDFKQIGGWESQIKNKGTPLSVFYESWDKLRSAKKNKQLTNKDKSGDYKLPILKKLSKKRKQNDGPVELFPSDDDESEVECILEKSNGNDRPTSRGKRGGKKSKKDTVDISGPVEDDGQKDIVEDLEISNW